MLIQGIFLQKSDYDHRGCQTWATGRSWVIRGMKKLYIGQAHVRETGWSCRHWSHEAKKQKAREQMSRVDVNHRTLWGLHLLLGSETNRYQQKGNAVDHMYTKTLKVLICREAFQGTGLWDSEGSITVKRQLSLRLHLLHQSPLVSLWIAKKEKTSSHCYYFQNTTHGPNILNTWIVSFLICLMGITIASFQDCRED